MASHLSRSAIAQNEKATKKRTKMTSKLSSASRLAAWCTAAAAPLGGPRRHLPTNQKPVSIPPEEEETPGEGEGEGEGHQGRHGGGVADVGVRVRLADLEPRLRLRRPRRWLRPGLPPRLLPG